MPRPATRFLCRWVPRRTTPRGFTASDAARVVCSAIANGATQTDIEERIALKCRWKETKEKGSIQQSVALLGVIDLFIENNNAWNDVMTQLQKINAALAVVALIAPFLRLIPFPPARLVAVAALRAVEGLTSRVNVFQGLVAGRRAANDAMIITLRKAANDGFNIVKSAA